VHDELPGAVQQPATHRDRIRQLENKVAQLEQAVASHAVIDQAIGVLVAVGRMTPAEAWDVLRETSMRTNIKVRHVAGLVVTWGESGKLAADIREQLSTRLSHRLTS
jgi:AmiR/NasT family two-component response regulator